MSIWLDYRKVNFSTAFKSFENIANEDFAQVEIEQNCNISQIWYMACNDIAVKQDCSSVLWKLTKGKLSFKVSKVLSSYGCTEIYGATVILENAEFRQESSGEILQLEQVKFDNVRVGWCAG